jgi:hypothetical protein
MTTPATAAISAHPSSPLVKEVSTDDPGRFPAEGWLGRVEGGGAAPCREDARARTWVHNVTISQHLLNPANLAAPQSTLSDPFMLFK